MCEVILKMYFNTDFLCYCWHLYKDAKTSHVKLSMPMVEMIKGSRCSEIDVVVLNGIFMLIKLKTEFWACFRI